MSGCDLNSFDQLHMACRSAAPVALLLLLCWATVQATQIVNAGQPLRPRLPTLRDYQVWGSACGIEVPPHGTWADGPGGAGLAASVPRSMGQRCGLRLSSHGAVVGNHVVPRSTWRAGGWVVRAAFTAPDARLCSRPRPRNRIVWLLARMICTRQKHPDTRAACLSPGPPPPPLGPFRVPPSGNMTPSAVQPVPFSVPLGLVPPTVGQPTS